MLCELDPDEFTRIRHLVPTKRQFIPIHAVIEHVYPGRIFVDSAAEPRGAYIWCYGRWAYVLGNVRNHSFLSMLAELLRVVILPQSMAMGMETHEIYSPNSTRWMAALETTLKPFHPHIHYESVFILDPDRFQERHHEITLPAQRRIEWMEMPVAPAGLPGWPRAGQRFRQRLKFGFGLVTGSTLLAYCGSNGFIANNEFMVEVDTFDHRDRRRGYATLVATALIDYCLNAGYCPVWETAATNIASQHIADNFGFQRVESYPVFAFPCLG